MKENRNKHSKKGQPQPRHNAQQNANSKDAAAPSGSVHTHPGAETTTEKKPISHRTADATNFGYRSYQED